MFYPRLIDIIQDKQAKKCILPNTTGDVSVGWSGNMIKRQHKVLVGMEIKQPEGKSKMKKKKRNHKQWLW